MIIYKFMRLAIFTFTLMVMCGCVEGEVEEGVEKWGMRRVFIEEEIEYGGVNTDTLFSPPISSGDYETRIFFPDVKFDNLSDDFDILKTELRECVSGFKYEIYGGGGVVVGDSIQSLDGEVNHSFNTNKPLSIWIDSRFGMDEESEYKIKVTQPSMVDGVCPNAIFVVGLAYKRYL